MVTCPQSGTCKASRRRARTHVVSGGMHTAREARWQAATDLSLVGAHAEIAAQNPGKKSVVRLKKRFACHLCIFFFSRPFASVPNFFSPDTVYALSLIHI